MKYQCCYMNEQTMEQCPKEGDFEVSENTRDDPDNYTYSCTEHLGEMIGTGEGFPECSVWTVTSLFKEAL